MKPLFWYNILKGVLVAAGVTLLLIGIFAFVGIKADDPSKYTSLYASVSLFVGAACGGIIASKGLENWLIAAVVNGVVCSVLVLIPSLIFADWESSSLLKLVLTIASSVIAAVAVHVRAAGDAKSSRRESEKRRRAIAKKYSGM